MTLIKIDRNSIKKNPDAGKTCERILGRVDIDFTLKGKFPSELLNENNCHVEQQSLDETGPIEYEGFILNPEIVPELIKLAKKKKDFNVTIKENRQYQDIFFQSQPLYLYKYENPKIPCPHCKELSKRKDFKPYDFDDNNYEAAVQCPKCKEVVSEFCLNLEFEDIDDVIAEMKNLI